MDATVYGAARKRADSNANIVNISPRQPEQLTDLIAGSAVVPFASTISLPSFSPCDFGDGTTVEVVLTAVRVGNAKAHAHIAG